MTLPQNIPLKQAATYLHVGTKTLRTLVEQGAIPASNTGTKGRAFWKFAQADLDAYKAAASRVKQMTSQEVATLAHCSVNTVTKAARQGDLPVAGKDKLSFLYDRDVVLRWIEARAHVEPAAAVAARKAVLVPPVDPLPATAGRAPWPAPLAPLPPPPSEGFSSRLARIEDKLDALLLRLLQ